MTRFFTTPGGSRRLDEKIKAALAGYDRVTASNEEAAGAGDACVWHDNFAYEENQRQMHQLAARVAELKEIRARTVVIDLPHAPHKVGIGTVVTIEDQESGQVSRYFVAGFEDGDPARDRLSYTAPLAKALLGAEAGDLRSFSLNNRTREFAILAINSVKGGEDA